jgi:hypothetical protein
VLDGVDQQFGDAHACPLGRRARGAERRGQAARLLQCAQAVARVLDQVHDAVMFVDLAHELRPGQEPAARGAGRAALSLGPGAMERQVTLPDQRLAALLYRGAERTVDRHVTGTGGGAQRCRDQQAHAGLRGASTRKRDS